MNCIKCAKPIPDDSDFCPYCGEFIEKSTCVSCPVCGKELPADSSFCQYCGTEVSSSAAKSISGFSVNLKRAEAVLASKPAKSKGKIGIWIVLIAIALLLVCGIVLLLINLQRSNQNASNTETSNIAEPNLESTVHQHDYKVIFKEGPTCEEARAVIYQCSCGDTYWDEEPAAHTYRKATCTKGEMCTVCGHIEGDALGHAFSDGVCTRCNVAQITLEQLQGTWLWESPDEYIKVTFIGDSVDCETLHAGEDVIAFKNGSIQFTGEGFYIEGIPYRGRDVNGNLYASSGKHFRIGEFTETYFVDLIDDINGPYTFYKQ